MIDKAYSPACDRNKGPIEEVLFSYLGDGPLNLLEIASGTGQHAAHFANNHPQWTWITSDLQNNHENIKQWVDGLNNVQGPLLYEAGKEAFPQVSFSAVFTANSLHIMSEDNGYKLIADLGENCDPGTYVFIYGPFNYNGKYSSDSNCEFDKKLKKDNPRQGIRDFEKIHEKFLSQGFDLIKDHEMPANNRILVFKKEN